jgi:hypothetical protein
LWTTRVGEPDAGNLHVRFDEGERLIPAPYSTASSCLAVGRLSETARQRDSETANSGERGTHPVTARW